MIRDVFIVCPGRHCLNELGLTLLKEGKEYTILAGDLRCQSWHNHTPDLRSRQVDIHDFSREELDKAWEEGEELTYKIKFERGLPLDGLPPGGHRT